MNERFSPYLEELRNRLLKSLAAITVATTLAFVFAKSIVKFLERPLVANLPQGSELVFTGLADKFMLLFKAAFLVGASFGVPVLLWQVWAFLYPALKPSDRSGLARLILASAFLFLGGMALAFYVALPPAVSFLLTVGGDIAKPMLTLKDYLDFEVGFLLVTGLLFEAPLVMYLLVRFGILTPESISGRRAEIFMVLAVLCAVATPSQDALTMFAVLVPLYGLFELGLMFSKRADRKKL